MVSKSVWHGKKIPVFIRRNRKKRKGIGLTGKETSLKKKAVAGELDIELGSTFKKKKSKTQKNEAEEKMALRVSSRSRKKTGEKGS